MKKIITMMMALVLTFGLAVPAFAANEITANEQRVYDSFVAVVDKWFNFDQKSRDRGSQFKRKAQKALLVAELNKTTCDDLQACVDRVAAFIADRNPKSSSDLKAISGDVLSMVNATANKYNIKVSLSDDRYADVMILKNGKYISVDCIGQGGSSGGSGCIRQTGYDLSATVVVAAMLVAAVGACFVVVGKKGLVVSPAE